MLALLIRASSCPRRRRRHPGHPGHHCHRCRRRRRLLRRCHHRCRRHLLRPRPSTAGRWPPPSIAAEAVSTIITDTLAAASTAAITASRPGSFPQGWRWCSTIHRTPHLPALSPVLDRLSRAQTLRLVYGSSRTRSVAALGGLMGRGRSAGRGRDQRPPTCCVHAAAAYAHACLSDSRDLTPLTMIFRLLP